jgi:hypothetical protein
MTADLWARRKTAGANRKSGILRLKGLRETAKVAQIVLRHEQFCF